jgi:predicted transposase YbfD/YdcC
VPAGPSSPIPPGLAPLRDASPLQEAEPLHLLAYLATIPDPRSALGRRPPLVAILALAAAAVLAGARSLPPLPSGPTTRPSRSMPRLAPGTTPPDHWAVPAEATIRRTLGRLDANALAAAVGAWLADRQRHDRSASAGHAQRRRPRQRAVAIDGKTLPGGRAAAGDGRPVHLLAAMDHTSRAVLAQHQVGGAPEEVCGFRPLLADLNLHGVVVTADALHTHPGAAEFLVTGKQAHYLFTVKANQPTLLARCTALPWHRVPGRRSHPRPGARPHRGAHPQGRLRPPPRFPHAAQVIQVTRKRTVGVPHASTRRRRRQSVTVSAITSLTFAQASPARLADLLRGHWAIENGLHYVRDVTFSEDASQIRTGTAPQVMATLRNLAIGALSRAGPVNLAAALRHHARDPKRPLVTLGITLG